MKVVINKCFGGFGLSHEAIMRYAELSGFRLYPYYDETALKIYGPEKLHECHFRHYSTKPLRSDAHGVVKASDREDGSYWSHCDLDRRDPMLVRVVEELGEKANDTFAALTVVEIPDDVDYEISEYDGQEHIAEKHRTWS